MINALMLKALIKNASRDNTRAYLSGVHAQIVEVRGKEFVRYQATNGHEIGQAFQPLQMEGDSSYDRSYDYLRNQPNGIIFDPTFIRWLVSVKKAAFPAWNNLLFTADGTLVSESSYMTYGKRLYNIDGLFPNTQKLWDGLGKEKPIDYIGLNLFNLERVTRAMVEAAEVLGYSTHKEHGLCLCLNFYSTSSPIAITQGKRSSPPSSHDREGWVQGLLMPMRIQGA